MLISIIIPVYNNEKYFPLAVQSIVEQNYSNWELIIIDDGSTDRTPEIADKIAARDRRIKVIHQKNQWIYASFNRGVEEASGDYIYILNSDDRIRQGSLALMADKANKYHPDVIWTKVLMHQCDAEQNIIAYDVANLDKGVKEEIFYQNERQVRDNWPFFIFSSLAQDQANLYRKELMKKYRFRNDVYGADTLFNISIARDIKSALVIKEPIYDFFIYRQSKMNVSVGKYYPYEHDMFNEIYVKYIQLFKEWKLPKESYEELFAKRRLKQITREIHALFLSNCPMTTEEKLKEILCKTVDDIVLDCAKSNNREEELESRILSGIRELLIREPIEEKSEMYFAYELLDSMLRYEKDAEDYEKMKAAIENPHNPHHIGKIFYSKLAGRESGGQHYEG